MDATLRKTAEIKLYTGDYCPYCRVVKKELGRLGLDYESVDSTHIIKEQRQRYA